MFAYIILAGCESNDNSPVKTGCEDVYWTYSGNDNGQERWMYLCDDFSVCGQKSQSPINITGISTDSVFAPLDFSYASSTVRIENDGHAIKFNCDSGSELTIGAKKYNLLEFHYHAQSEHQINGQNYPLEVHFVHAASLTDLAVVGVLFEVGEENELLKRFLDKFPIEKGVYNDSTSSFDLISLLPENKSFYHYRGSLTTPPCSETVSWYVLKNTVTASEAQLTLFAGILRNNYRYVQSLNGRLVFGQDI
jgi:carbonic anhydrase